MQKSKTIFLMLFLILVLIIILVLKNVFNKQENLNTTTLSNPQTKATVTSINLTDQPFSITEPILVQFSQPVLENTLKILLKPETPSRITFDSSREQLIIDPEDAWSFDTTYQLIISGLALDKEYIYTFKTMEYSGI